MLAITKTNFLLQRTKVPTYHYFEHDLPTSHSWGCYRAQTGFPGGWCELSEAGGHHTGTNTASPAAHCQILKTVSLHCKKHIRYFLSKLQLADSKTQVMAFGYSNMQKKALKTTIQTVITLHIISKLEMLIVLFKMPHLKQTHISCMSY